jgi:ABC-2 type transport system ATP-binding protein
LPGTIAIDHFSKQYGDICAVRDLTVTVASGQLFGLIGPDGAGKTTTIRTICTLLKCEQGGMTIDGYDVNSDVAAIRAILGYMPQRFSLYPDLSVQQNLRFFADLFGVPKAEKSTRLEQLYGFSKLEPFKNRLAGALSGGMKQKLALSCTLIHTPRVLVLDEPTTGVDPVSRREFWQILRRLRDEGVTILVSTPYMDEADLCDRVAFMFDGRILALDRPEALQNYFPHHLYEIAAEQVRSLVPFFQTQTGAVSVQIFGDSLHVSFTQLLTDEARDSMVRQAPAAVLSFRKITPSVEDTFLALMTQQGESS